MEREKRFEQQELEGTAYEEKLALYPGTHEETNL